jgi:ribosome-associated protein
MAKTEQKNQIIPVERYPIRLGQFMKRAAIASDGSEAKQLIFSGSVLVNDKPESRRGRQLRRGDVVSVGSNAYQCG